MCYTSYHTNVFLAAHCGVLPEEIRRIIPRSTLCAMRKGDPSALFGLDVEDLPERVELVKEIVRHRSALTVATTVVRLAHLIRSLGVPIERIKRIKNPELRARIAQTVQRLQAILPRARIARLLGVSAFRLRSWSRNALACLGSPRSLCRRVYPNQLTVKEVSVIRKGFADPRFAHWPAVSVAWYLVNTQQVTANVETITHCAKLLGLAGRKPPRKHRRRGSVAATRPNQVWHLDVTFVRTLDNVKAAVQLVQDNFSRKIIAWNVSLTVSGLNTAELLRKAYATVRRIPTESIDLVVDGGAENNNADVEHLIEPLPLKKLIAQVDIVCSNSMIEAMNKILKYQYLFQRPIPDAAHLEKSVEEAVEDFNNRPSGKHRGLTPNEAYDGEVFDKAAYHERILEAGIRRRAVNRSVCPPCIGPERVEGAVKTNNEASE